MSHTLCVLCGPPSKHGGTAVGCQRPAAIAGSDAAVSLDPRAGQRDLSRDRVLGVLAGPPGAGWEGTPRCSGVHRAGQAVRVTPPRLDVELALGVPVGGQAVVPCSGVPVATASLQTCARHAEPGVCSVTADFRLMFEAPICYLSRWRPDRDSTCVPISGPLGWGLSCRGSPSASEMSAARLPLRPKRVSRTLRPRVWARPFQPLPRKPAKAAIWPLSGDAGPEVAEPPPENEVSKLVSGGCAR